MPKASLKIDRFEGGINENRESRDIEDNQAVIVQDSNINSIGRVSLSGGAVNYFEEVDSIEIKESGYGLFSFRSDYDIIDDDGLKGGMYLHGSDTIARNVNSNLGSERSVDILAKLYDPVNTSSGKKAGILLRESESEKWTPMTEALPLYEDENYIKAPVRPKFEMANNALRIWDSNFKQFGMTNKWFGVVKGTKFIGKDNVNYDSSNTPAWNVENAWLYTHAECKPPTSVQSELFNRINDTRWQDQTLSSPLSGNHSDNTDTTLDVDSGSTFSPGDIILINSELISVTSISTNELTVVRGVYGATATAHSDNDVVRLVYRANTNGEVYSPFNYGYYPSLNNFELSHKDYNCQVIGLDFSESDGADEIYADTTPGEPAADFQSLGGVDSDTTHGWGLATDGINNWSQEFDGIQFGYEFQEETDEEVIPWRKGFKYRFYASLIYDEEPGTTYAQESILTDITPINSNVLNKDSNLYCYLSVKWTGQNKDFQAREDAPINNTQASAYTGTTKEIKKELYINPRVTGCKIYYSSNEDNDSQKYALLTAWFDENGGIKKSEGLYAPWCPVRYGSTDTTSHYRISSKSDDNDTLNVSHHLDLVNIAKSGNAFKFETPPDTGDYSGIENSNVLYKCSTVVNGIRYVGNLYYPVKFNESVAEVPGASFEQLSGGKKYGDQIIAGNNGDDIFDTRFLFKSSEDDGDEITHLDSLDDYLFIFKENSLTIFNTYSQQAAQEFKRFKFKGVTKPYHVVRTDKEMFWVNKYGAFLWNGEQIIDISKGKLKDMFFLDLFENNSDIIVGYDIIERTVILQILLDNDLEGYSYHLDNEAWVRYKDAFPLIGKVSNFANDKEGKLLFSVFNESNQAIQSTVNGLRFAKATVAHGEKHLINLSNSNPVDQNGNSFSFLDNAYFEPGKIINIRNTGLTSADVIAAELQFNRLSFLTNENKSNMITLFTTQTAGTRAAHLDKFDIIHIEQDGIYFTTRAAGFDNDLYLITGMQGYWQVASKDPFVLFDNGAQPPPNPASMTRDPDVDIIDDPDTIADLDDDLIEDPAGVNYPNQFKLIKRTDVGTGVETEDMVIKNSSGIIVTQEIMSAINRINNIVDNTTVVFIKNGSSENTPLPWKTLFYNKRDEIQNYNRLPINNYFDGNYRIKSIITALILEVSKQYGDGRLQSQQYGDAPTKFNRFYYDLISNTALASTSTVNDQMNNFVLSNIQLWDRRPKGSKYFTILTKDIDFQEPARNKKIYKLLISYTCEGLPAARVAIYCTTSDGKFILFPDLNKCKNYGLFNGGIGLDQQIHENIPVGKCESFSRCRSVMSSIQKNSEATAEIVFNDPNNHLNNCKSIQILIVSSGKNLNEMIFNLQDMETGPEITYTEDPSVGQGIDFDVEVGSSFVVNDINIIYRAKNVK
tara:strand:- start:1391 stop:5605 length:4215 start_codon:yes stop_codon:yes gene_type:complete